MRRGQWFFASISGFLFLVTILVFVFGLGYSGYRAYTANEPIQLTLEPCIAGICLAGDNIKLNFCLNGKQKKTVTVKLESPAFVNESKEYQVSYDECRDLSIPLKSDLPSDKYQVTASMPLDADVSVFLKLKRKFKEMLNMNVRENYVETKTFNPQYPDVDLIVREKDCNLAQAKLSYGEVTINLKEGEASAYSCKLRFETRRFVSVMHQHITKIYESNVNSDEDSRIWESEYWDINNQRGAPFLNIGIVKTSNLDYINPAIIPICKVNGNDVIVYPEVYQDRCP